jgi:hypothetical protein
MISTANQTKGSKEAIDYILNDKGKAEELDRNLISGTNGAEILSEFRKVQSLKPNVKNNTYSIILSPDNKQKKFTKDELKDIGREHLKNLGLDKNQYLMTLHKSTGKPHLHFQVNRISIDGKRHNDSLISKKAQESAEKIAKSKGLITAKEIQQLSKEETKHLRKEILEAYNKSKFKALSLEEFEKNMHNKGYNLEYSRQKKTNKIQGFRIIDRQSGQSFKASEIHKSVRYNKLTDEFERNRQLLQREEREQERPSRNKGGFTR